MASESWGFRSFGLLLLLSPDLLALLAVFNAEIRVSVFPKVCASRLRLPVLSVVHLSGRGSRGGVACWQIKHATARSREAEEQRSRGAEKQRSREAERRGSREARTQGSREAGKQRRKEAGKQRRKEAKKRKQKQIREAIRNRDKLQGKAQNSQGKSRKAKE
ncbi:hypothetical protein HOO65_020092 [Ceratocystis lukuohia]|uniref:Uncharacterized protein n=1 Tax=Ceratocystis lukuohia TaxID=2019550 RepID=A0ABR4MMU4_9PEZI